MLDQLPDPADVEAAQKQVADGARRVDDAKKAKAKARGRSELTAERDTAHRDSYRTIKADFDSKSSFYNIDVDERDQAGISRRGPQGAGRARSKRGRRNSTRLQKDLDDAQKAVDEADAEYKRRSHRPGRRKAENELADAEDELKKLTGNFDRFAKLTVQKEWGFGDCVPVAAHHRRLRVADQDQADRAQRPDDRVRQLQVRARATTAAPPATWPRPRPASTTAR